MKGLVVVVCAPSQGGKDFIISQTMAGLESIDDMKTSYATSYKFREPREDDAEYIYCVKDEKDIPVKEQDKMTATVYGTERIVYDRKEITDKLDKGEIVFIATASSELAEKVKAEFGPHSIAVFVKRQQVNEETMVYEDLKRHGINPNSASSQNIEESVARVRERIARYESMKPEFEAFVADNKHGADYIFKNWYTLMGGRWNTTIDEKGRREFYLLCNFIMNVHRANEKKYGNWRENPHFDLFDKEERTKNLFTMQDEWIKYIQEKRENE